MYVSPNYLAISLNYLWKDHSPLWRNLIVALNWAIVGVAIRIYFEFFSDKVNIKFDTYWHIAYL